MRILLLSDYPPLFQALQHEAARYSGLEIQRVDPSTEVLTLPDFQFLLLDPMGRQAEAGLDAAAPQQQDLWQQRLPLLTELCSLREAQLLLLSSDQVFAPQQQSVSELDTPLGDTPIARFLLELENLTAQLPQSLILRIPPLLSSQPDGGLQRLIDRCHQHLAPANLDYRGLQPLDDLARVLLGILLQADAGARAWGLYHYAGSEPVSQTELMHTLARYLKAEPYPADPSGTMRQGMNTQHLLETFGVHPRAWRTRLPDLLIQLHAIPPPNPASEP